MKLPITCENSIQAFKLDRASLRRSQFYTCHKLPSVPEVRKRLKLTIVGSSGSQGVISSSN